MQFLGGSLDLRPAEGWTLADRWLIDGGDMDTNALLFQNAESMLPPRTLQTFERVGASARADLSIPVLRVVVPF